MDEMNLYTAILNEVMDNFVVYGSINPSDFLVFAFILRNTYGCFRESCSLSTAEISRGCHLSPRTIFKSVKALKQAHLITVTENKADNGGILANIFAVNTTTIIHAFKRG